MEHGENEPTALKHQIIQHHKHPCHLIFLLLLYGNYISQNKVACLQSPSQEDAGSQLRAQEPHLLATSSGPAPRQRGSRRTRAAGRRGGGRRESTCRSRPEEASRAAWPSTSWLPIAWRPGCHRETPPPAVSSREDGVTEQLAR